MRFTQILLAAASAVLSQAVTIDNSDFSSIAVGKEFDITFSESVGPTTVYLGTGTQDNVIRGAAIGTAAGTSGTIPWTPTEGGSFALVIVDAGSANSATNPNYSVFFTVSGGSSSSSTSSSSTGSGSSSISTTSNSASSTTALSTTTSAPSTSTLSTTALFTTTSFSNSTKTSTEIKTKSSSSTTSSSAGAASATHTQVPSSVAAGIASPLAFVFLALAALGTLN